MATVRRFWAAALIVVLAICPLGSACLAHAAMHAAAGGGPAHAGDAEGHDHSHHADHSKPVKAGTPDGCSAIQHCAPFSWTAAVETVCVLFDVAAVRFSSAGAVLVHGIDRDPDVPPPRRPS